MVARSSRRNPTSVTTFSIAESIVGMACLKQSEDVRRSISEFVVVNFDTQDVSVVRQRFGLRFDFLGDKHSPNRRQHWIAVEKLQVASELLDPVDFATSFDFDGNGHSIGVLAKQVDRADVRRIFASYERHSWSNCIGSFGQKFLKIRLDAFLLQAGIDAEIVGGIAQNMMHRDGERFTFGVGHRPDPCSVPTVEFVHRVRRCHPVQRFVGTAVRMDTDTTIGFDHYKSGRLCQRGGKTALILNGATGDNKTHGVRRYSKIASNGLRIRAWRAFAGLVAPETQANAIYVLEVRNVGVGNPCVRVRRVLGSK